MSDKQITISHDALVRMARFAAGREEGRELSFFCQLIGYIECYDKEAAKEIADVLGFDNLIV